MIVGGVSLEAALAARKDDAETASIIVNGRKGLYEHGHRGEPAVLVSNAALCMILGGKVHVRPARSSMRRGGGGGGLGGLGGGGFGGLGGSMGQVQFNSLDHLVGAGECI